MASLTDTFERPLRDLRISVTDRCNFRCTYCMPFDEYEWIAKPEILTFEEITRLARLFVSLGIEEIRLTGGEPLVRKDLAVLVGSLSAIDGLKDLSLTTNGALLVEQAEELKAAGLDRVNVSLDTLDAGKFKRITKRGDLAEVLAGIAAAERAGLTPIKINAVIEKGVNDDEIVPLAEFARERGYAMRYIEYMDVGNSNHWQSAKMVSKREIIAAIEERWPLREAGRADGSAPAVDYAFSDGAGDIGVIASVTEPFCGSCTRARLTSDGKLVTCLFSNQGTDLKALLRGGAGDGEIADAIRGVWSNRRDRYSEERLYSLNSESGYRPEEHYKIEMIRLGG
jgi:cyclic pyranopterin phosphate synthase